MYGYVSLRFAAFHDSERSFLSGGKILYMYVSLGILTFAQIVGDFEICPDLPRSAQICPHSRTIHTHTHSEPVTNEVNNGLI